MDILIYAVIFVIGLASGLYVRRHAVQDYQNGVTFGFGEARKFALEAVQAAPKPRPHDQQNRQPAKK